jgi:hypothetical protein
MNVQIASRRLSRDAWIFLVAAVAEVMVGAYVGKTGSFMPLLAFLAIAAVVAARARPRFALATGLAAMALPYTWSPQIPKLGSGMGILVGLLLLIAYLPTLTGFRPVALDFAVLAFAVTPAWIGAFQGELLHLTEWMAPAITLPYFGFRLFFEATDARRVFAPVVIAIGVVVSLIGIWESLTGHNPIVAAGTMTYSSGGHYVTAWDVPLYRGGRLRALSTFGHPIAFGMFLLIPLAFALARRGFWNLAAAGVILAAVALTYSRGPWVGALVVLLLLVGRGRGRIIAVAASLVAAAIFVEPVHRILLESGSASTEAGHNTYYRLGLVTQAIHGTSLLGHPFTDIQSAIPDYADVTSLLAGTIIQTGMVGVAELTLIAWLVIRALLHARRGADPDQLAAAAALTAQLVGLLAVTLITNYQFFFWALVAYVATGGHALPGRGGTVGLSRDRPPGDATQAWLGRKPRLVTD